MTSSDIVCLAAAVVAAAVITFVVARGPSGEPFPTPLTWSTGQ